MNEETTVQSPTGKFNVWRFLLSGVLFTIVAQIIHTLSAWISMGYYTDPKYMAVWSKIMMPEPGPPPIEFTYYSFLFGLIGALLFSLVYILVRDALHQKNAALRGLWYGFLIFLVAGIPSALAIILLINLPLWLIIIWAVENLVIYLLGGMIIAAINK